MDNAQEDAIPNTLNSNPQDGQKNSVLLRLEHIFEVQEDRGNMSKPVLVNLEVLFKAFDILSVEEVTLGANLQVEKLHRLQWDVMNEVPTSKTRQMEEGGEEEYVQDVLETENGKGSWPVKMQPFQIRTFIIDLNAKL